MIPGNAPITAIEADLGRQMALMDRLPAPLKRVVWDAPIPLDLVQVEQIRKAYGKNAPSRLRMAITREYPQWRP